MKEELADFLRFCSLERRLAPLTCAAYERDVSACLAYLQGVGLTDLAEVRPTHLRAFLAEDAKRRPAPSSQARATAALKSFFRFLVDDQRLARDPARPLRTPKKREVLPDVLTMAELGRQPPRSRSRAAAVPIPRPNLHRQRAVCAPMRGVGLIQSSQLTERRRRWATRATS